MCRIYNNVKSYTMKVKGNPKLQNIFFSVPQKVRHTGLEWREPLFGGTAPLNTQVHDSKHSLEVLKIVTPKSTKEAGMSARWSFLWPDRFWHGLAADHRLFELPSAYNWRGGNFWNKPEAWQYSSGLCPAVYRRGRVGLAKLPGDKQAWQARRGTLMKSQRHFVILCPGICAQCNLETAERSGHCVWVSAQVNAA